MGTSNLVHARHAVDATALACLSFTPDPAAVRARPRYASGHDVAVELGGHRTAVTVYGPAELIRAWVVEIDRQLAPLDVDQRINQTIEETEQ